MNHFRSVHRDLKKTGELTVQEGINHTDLINMVSEGVKNALVHSPGQDENIESLNTVSETEDLKKQLAEMQLIIKDLQSSQQHQPPPPFYQHPSNNQRNWQKSPFQNMTHRYNNNPYANNYYPRGNKHIKNKKPRKYC